jgi:hypothetical protein
MIVAVVAVWVVEVPVDDVIDVFPVPDLFVATAGTVLVLRAMGAAVVVGCAVLWIAL